MTKKSEAARTESIERLKEWGVKPGDTIYTILKSVSASGMSRKLSVFKIENNEPVWLSYHVARIVGSWDDKSESVRVSGVGMDMGFHTVYALSSALFPDGFGCIGDGCPSNDHSNGDRDYTPHVQMLPDWDHVNSRHTDTLVATVVGAGHWHSDGGYALKHRWLS